MKRFIDIIIATLALVLFAPVLLVAALLVWADDGHNPLHFSARVGRREKPFFMLKLRTMRETSHAHSCYVTTAKDERITRIGKWLRRYKLDELPQLVNVLKGDMSIVGPRPRMQSEISDYTAVERRIFEIRPGTTDIATILFSIEERKILKNAADPNEVYNQILRPWKGKLNLFYLEHQSLALDLRIIFLTSLVIVRRKLALELLARMMHRMNAPRDIVAILRRKREIGPIPLPGEEPDSWPDDRAA